MTHELDNDACCKLTMPYRVPHFPFRDATITIDFRLIDLYGGCFLQWNHKRLRVKIKQGKVLTED